jgi:hypothetical protein
MTCPRGEPFLHTDRDGAQGVDVQRVRLHELPGHNASGPMMRIGGDAGMQGGEEGGIALRRESTEGYTLLWSLLH